MNSLEVSRTVLQQTHSNVRRDSQERVDAARVGGVSGEGASPAGCAGRKWRAGVVQ